jgi:uncharacterized iron-regulated protein
MTRLLTALTIAVAATIVLAADTPPAIYVPERVYASAHRQFADFETMLADLTRADVVFVGEQHDDPNTHRLELELIEGLARRRGEIVLSLEMFERDVQEPLQHFLMGHIDEGDFLRDARPWPDYATDYKPLVDFAAASNWAVIAANVPRSIAAEVATGGLDVLKTKSETEQAWFARDVRCPPGDAYFRRFADAMVGHGGATSGSAGPATNAGSLERFYDAQCLKDETMGESIAQAYMAGAVGGKRPLVVSVNGAFHSDYHEGLVERTRRRLPDKRLVVLTILPVDTLDQLAPDADARKRADYLIYTVKTRVAK